MTTVVFPGRFQPFHHAHFRILENLLKRFDRVIVVIGSSNVRDDDNPFGPIQRKKMIRSCFPRTKKKRLLFAFVPFASDETWVRELLKKVPRSNFNVVFSNNPRVQKQLRLHAIAVISSPLFSRNRLEGKRIRNWPRNWQKNVPKPVATYLKNVLEKESL
ncbi:adenylyltransferase/cytidyltransferase family protein [Candidatus Micrarchaeota archaeon]|nr:adenylyltransferase/cytidyltransferase family protein [Candidatus Micrarchaeota archaeon]